MTKREKPPAKNQFDAAERMVQRMGPWRYLQFVLVALISGAAAYGLFDLSAITSGVIGVIAGTAYFGLEKWRGSV